MSPDALETSRRIGHLGGMATPASTNGTEPAVGLTAADVMTASDAAKFLHIPVFTVYELTRRGELPAKRVGRTWRFVRPRIEEYLWS